MQTLTPLFLAISILTPVLPVVINILLPSFIPSRVLTAQHYQLFHSFSLLLLGMFLSTLATLNFSLAFVVGLLSSPLSFVRPVGNPALRAVAGVLLAALAPTTVILAGANYVGLGIADVLREAAFGWTIWGMYTSVVVWCVWWPAWIMGATVLLGTPWVRKQKAA